MLNISLNFIKIIYNRQQLFENILFINNNLQIFVVKNYSFK
ncbi:hypothetical protein RPATATE_0680 [Rickettsia parkeri str. Tate's Hell]|uniref:Uncharacterized protein n=2 Tax=spotted fever group TaxID=114277 RepID=A0ABM5MQD4_RICS1|nr:hypothetical protein Rsl_1017 [Rickettsia slovaca 13-B]KJV95536.1 hypothetical protein RPAAT24_0241 [Rickettsia parkeri str. AT\